MGSFRLVAAVAAGCLLGTVPSAVVAECLAAGRVDLRAAGHPDDLEPSR